MGVFGLPNFCPGDRARNVARARQIYTSPLYHNTSYHICQVLFLPLGLHNKLTDYVNRTYVRLCAVDRCACVMDTGVSAGGGHLYASWRQLPQLGRGHLSVSWKQLELQLVGHRVIKNIIRTYVRKSVLGKLHKNVKKCYIFLVKLRIDFFENLWYNIYRKNKERFR